MANDLTKQQEQLAAAVAQSIYDKTQAMIAAVGERPWGGQKLTQEQKLEHFRAVREAPDFWAQQIAKEQQALGLDPSVMPKNLIMEAQKLEAQHRAGSPAVTMPTAQPETNGYTS